MSIKKIAKIVVKPISKAYLYEQMFDEAKRLDITIPQMKDLLAKKCKNHGIDIKSLTTQLRFLKQQKSLNDYSLNELAQWRNDAAGRIKALKITQRMLVKDIEQQLNCFGIASAKLQKKLDSNIRWYKSLGKVISNKIDGVRFSEIIE